MDLSTTYMGFKLPHPLMPGASPLTDNLDNVRKLEDAGAPAIVMRSLFEEQIVAEQISISDAIDTPSEAIAEAVTFFPDPEGFILGAHEYLEQVRKIKDAVDVPVIASLSGTTKGGWLQYADLIQQAGADGLELNVYTLATDPNVTGDQIERQTLELAAEVKKTLRIPIAVKLSPFYSSIPNIAMRLDDLKVDGLVIFNRFYQPDIDPEALEVKRALQLSDSSELLLRLRWLAVLSGRINAPMAVTGGVHTTLDAIKSIMAGAGVVQMVSGLLKNGPRHLQKLRVELQQWMEANEFASIEKMRGNMSLRHSPNPGAYERANYMQILQTWSGWRTIGWTQ